MRTVPSLNRDRRWYRAEILREQATIRNMLAAGSPEWLVEERRARIGRLEALDQVAADTLRASPQCQEFR